MPVTIKRFWLLRALPIFFIIFASLLAVPFLVFGLIFQAVEADACADVGCEQQFGGAFTAIGALVPLLFILIGIALLFLLGRRRIEVTPDGRWWFHRGWIPDRTLDMNTLTDVSSVLVIPLPIIPFAVLSLEVGGRQEYLTVHGWSPWRDLLRALAVSAVRPGVKVDDRSLRLMRDLR